MDSPGITLGGSKLLAGFTFTSGLMVSGESVSLLLWLSLPFGVRASLGLSYIMTFTVRALADFLLRLGIFKSVSGLISRLSGWVGIGWGKGEKGLPRLLGCDGKEETE